MMAGCPECGHQEGRHKYGCSLSPLTADDLARAAESKLTEIRSWLLRIRWADECLADEGIGPELGPLIALLGGDPNVRITGDEIERAFEESLATMDPETAAEIRRGLVERPGHAASREVTP